MVETMSPFVVNHILLLLHSILCYGCEKDGNQTVPIKIIYPKEQPKELRVLNQEEQLRLMTYLEEDIDAYKLSVIISSPKTHSSIRTIPLTEGVLKFCQQLKCSDSKTFLLTGKKNMPNQEFYSERYNNIINNVV